MISTGNELAEGGSRPNKGNYPNGPLILDGFNQLFPFVPQLPRFFRIDDHDFHFGLIIHIRWWEHINFDLRTWRFLEKLSKYDYLRVRVEFDLA